MKLDLVTHSPEETQALGRTMGELARPGDALLLVGGLGTGKTCLTQGIAWGLGINEYLERLEHFDREDVAAWLQKNTEREVADLVGHWVRRTGVRDVVLAGGLFANVRLNQEIHQLPEVESVFVFPHMGDGGLAVGAVMARQKPEPVPLRDACLGPEYSRLEIEGALKAQRVRYEPVDDIEVTIAKLLADGKVVARFNGRMEYGPRALGNRSILYQTTDVTVNDWLNDKLQRNKFMPFTSSTLAEEAHRCYKNLEGAEYPAKFMTITFDATDWMKARSPGTVHLDGTSRPQLVSKEENPSYYKIIDEYRKLTGIPSVLNTSFNMHEEPIVCSPDDAIQSFMRSGLDYLAVGDYLVRNPEADPARD